MPTSPSDTRPKWRRPRAPKTTKRHRPQDDDDDDNNNNDDNDVTVEPDYDEDLHPPPNPNPSPNPKTALNRAGSATDEVVSGGGVRISDFPTAVRHTVNRPHSSVLAVVAAERGNKGSGVVTLENVSYGQLQALSAVPADCVALVGADQEGSVVVRPLQIREGRGLVKRFWNRVHVVPHHADWFQPNSVHRLERQVVPHFFSGKSPDHSPEKYMDFRNLIVAKYMENPEKRLSLGDLHGLAVGVDLEDLSRIFRFLDHWGIINYCTSVPHQEAWNMESYLREDSKGEVQVPSAKLKSIDSLIKFDKPKCMLKASEIYSSSPSKANDLADMDTRLREILSENHCSHCSRSLLAAYYQSTKDADTFLCQDCYHEGRFVIGHSSIDFTKIDSAKEFVDQDGESWTDQETLLLLEAVEVHNDNWHEIAEYVGTKSKAQCILHFLRLPVEDGLLEKVEVPTTSTAPNGSHNGANSRSYSHVNGVLSGPHDQESESDDKFPFANSSNPVMHLIAFLTSAIGPRVAAACAHASLAVLSEDDGSVHGNRMDSDDASVDARNAGQKDENLTAQGSSNENNANKEGSLPAKRVKAAATAGLAAAAMKAKMFADHEEREIQRLSASVINNQLKRLELKLKQFAEIETLLMKECEQVEKTRQRFAVERARAIASRFGPTSGVGSAMNMPGVSPPQVVGNNRAPPVMSASPSSQPTVSGYANNQVSPSQMPFMQRQQMYGFGPRLPLSALQPSSSGPSPNAMFGAQPSGQSSLSHPVLRPVPGTSSGMG